MSCLTTHGIGRITRLPSSTIRNHRTHAQARHDAFTLVELLVVISIIALLIAILLPALRQARQAAYMAGSLSNIRQLTLAQHLYAEDNDGSLPFHTFRTHLPDVGGGITANVPPWTQAMLQMGYIQGDARSVFWSPGRDLSAINTNLAERQLFDQGDMTYSNPWQFMGYGMNVRLTASEQSAGPVVNLNKKNVHTPSEAMLLAETWSDNWLPGSGAGYFRLFPARNSGIGLFTYNGGVARSYLDGHASGADASDLDWHVEDQYNGEWDQVRYGCCANKPDGEAGAPWFRDWKD